MSLTYPSSSKELEREQEQAILEKNIRKRDTHLDLEKPLYLGGDKAKRWAIAVVSQVGQTGANSVRHIINGNGDKRVATSVAGSSTLTPLIETSEENQASYRLQSQGERTWIDIPPLIVDSSDSLEVERVFSSRHP
jgi:hypothetical protein